MCVSSNALEREREPVRERERGWRACEKRWFKQAVHNYNYSLMYDNSMYRYEPTLYIHAKGETINEIVYEQQGYLFY